MADYVGGDMIRGHIDTIILNSLIDGDKDTNQIKAEIEARAGGQFQLKQGTFYSALQRIVKQGYVIEYRTTGADGVRRKFFQLTEKGKDLIDKNQSSWTVSRQVINTLLDAQAEKINKVKEAKKAEEDELPEFDHSEITNFSNLEKSADKVEESVAQQVIASINDDDIEDEGQNEQPTVSDLTVESVIESNEESEDLSALNETPPVFNPSETIEDSTPQTFEQIVEILENLDRVAREEEERQRQEQELQRIEKEKLLAEEKAREDEKLKELASKEESKSDFNETVVPDEFQIAEEISKDPVPLHIDEQPQYVVPDYVQKALDKEFAYHQMKKEEQISIANIVANINEPDDYLNANDIPSQKEYKSILSHIFAADEKDEQPTISKAEVEIAQPTTVTQVNAVTEDVVESEETQYDRLVDELDFSDIPQKAEKDANSTVRKGTKKTGAFDYSDIMELSEREGFKVNTSDRTNKSELGKILINRLNFHTSLIFFILVCLETLLVALTMDNILVFGIETYIYFSVIILAFPVINGMIYYMAPKRTVAEVSTFKSAFETALIITLNLILMILVYTVIIDLDFSSTQELTRNLFLPLLMIINVPIYIIIRYSLLEKQMYFS